MAAGTEDEVPLFIADGVVLFVDGDDVGVVLLFGEGDIELDVEGVFVIAFYFADFLAEECAVFGRDSEMEVDCTVGHASVFGSFNDVFFERGSL